jgi:hypothetical protein
MAVNYTPEQTEYITKIYCENPCRETVDLLAEELDKPKKSIIGKLSKEGVYRAQVYQTKLGEKPVTKVELVHDIANLLNVSVDSLKGLDKTPKLTLRFLKKTLSLTADLI